MKEFRQLTVDDAAEYHEVLIAGYAENKNYPISFDAINFSQEESRAWILKYPVYGLYVDGSLVCSISFRMPAVTLGTAAEHPWLAKMYEDFGFKEYKRVQLPGKVHTTIFFKKTL